MRQTVLPPAQQSLQLGTTPPDTENIACLSPWSAHREGHLKWLWICSGLVLMLSFAVSMRLWQHLGQAVEISCQIPTSSFLRSHPLPQLPNSKPTGFLSYNGSCAWLERDGERSVEETFQRLLPWPQKMAGAASMASSEERQLDCGTAITVRCSARCCSLRFSVLTHTIALCSYQPFQKAFFSPLTFCSLWHVRSRGLQRSLQKWQNICWQEKKNKNWTHTSTSWVRDAH